jgi:hypothetical protein
MTALSEIPPTSKKYSVPYHFDVTAEMDQKVTQILARQERSMARSDLLRAALREYLDDQEDVIGSRRHFSKSLQRRLDLMEFKIIFYLDILIYLIAASQATLLAYVTKDSKVQSLNLIRIAIKAAMKEGPEMNQQLGGVIAELTDES